MPALPQSDLFNHWPLPHRSALRRALEVAWAGPDRGYHDLLHLREVLAAVSRLGEDVEHDTTSVVLAAWFHDAVYDTAPEPERRSAEWAARALPDAEVDVAEVVRLVMLTVDHRVEEDDANGAVLCDADLAILAAPQPRYDAYVAGVRHEYAHLTDAEFAVGRSMVLRDLVSLEHLFTTTRARRDWEPTARINITNELLILEQVVSDAEDQPSVDG